MPRHLAKLTRRSAAMLAGLFALVLATCRGRSAGSVPTTPAAQVIASHSDSLMAIPGVVGVYEGRGRGGETVIRVMLAARSDSTLRRIPRRLDGYRVEVEVSGPIVPLGH